VALSYSHLLPPTRMGKNLETMIGATKAQLFRHAIGAMTFKEINPTPPLKMGRRTICQ